MASLSNRLFEQMPPPGKPVTIKGIAETLNVPNRRMVNAMDLLRKQGFVQRLETGCYQLTSRGLEARAAGQRITSGPHGPHTGQRKPQTHTLYAKAWKALRARGSATVDDMLQVIGDTPHKDPRNAIQQYLLRLSKAGYIAIRANHRAGTAVTSPGFNVYILLPDKNTGPKAPYYSVKHQKIIDLNVSDEGVTS